MLRSVLTLSLSSLTVAAFAAPVSAPRARPEAARVSPRNVLDERVVGVFRGGPSGLNVNGSARNHPCTVSFQYAHEEHYSATTLLYYKVRIEFPGLDYNANFLEPADFDFLVSRDYLLNSYPSDDFVVSSFVPHRRDYRALRLQFTNGRIGRAQAFFGGTGSPTSAPNWSWIGAYTCTVR